jgi:hypothetical protein
MNNGRVLLVGDNPFHGISHLSQEKAIQRGKNLSNPTFAAGLVRTAIDNGADGFMFSVSNTTLSIVKQACAEQKSKHVQLYVLAPYVFEFVRMAVTEGGIIGLTKKVGREIVTSANIGAILQGAKGAIFNDPGSLMKAYLLYEESRIRAAAGKNGELVSIYLHEVLTDMALAMDMEWIFRAHIDLMEKRGIKPGFHTHSLPHLLRKLNQWRIDPRKISITTQFNSLGFLMCPDKEKVEEALKLLPEGTDVIAYGVLASGYLKLDDAIAYVNSRPQLKGVVVGVSREQQAQETFQQMKGKLL